VVYPNSEKYYSKTTMDACRTMDESQKYNIGEIS
jgi:hypothetical protein